MLTSFLKYVLVKRNKQNKTRFLALIHHASIHVGQSDKISMEYTEVCGMNTSSRHYIKTESIQIRTMTDQCNYRGVHVPAAFCQMKGQ